MLWKNILSKLIEKLGLIVLLKRPTIPPLDKIKLISTLFVSPWKSLLKHKKNHKLKIYFIPYLLFSAQKAISWSFSSRHFLIQCF